MKKFCIILIALLLVSGAMTQTQQPCSACLPGGITFTNQAQIDNFQANYPGCTEIEGDVMISGYNINNLNGLSALTSIGGYLFISANTFLPSLAGLDNIAVGSIQELQIHHNDLLSSCAVQSTCEYLAAPGGTLNSWIYYNAPGCNSDDEVLEACETLGIESAVSVQRSAVIVNPNPTEGISHFAFHISQYQWVTLKIYDMHGREVADLLDQKLPAGEQVVRWDASDLPAGMYFARLQAGNEVTTMKVIKVE